MSTGSLRLERLSVTLAVVGFVGLTVVALLSLIDVTLRSFDLPRMPGLYDIKEVCFAVIVSSCFPLGLIEGNHVTVRILRRVLPRIAGRLLDLLGATVTLVFFALATAAFAAAAADLSDAGRTTFSLELPMAPWLWVIAAMLAVSVLVQAAVVFDLLSGGRRAAPGTPERAP